MIQLRPYQSTLIERARAIISASLGGDFLVNPRGVSAGTSLSANVRKHERHAEGFCFNPMKICSVPGCGKPHDSLGYCGKHAQRVRRYGDPNYLTPEETRRANNRAAQMASRPSVRGSYVKLNGRHEHRVVAEQILGRPLKRGEIVHHIDGNRRNNDPSNLQIMTQSEHAALHFDEMMQARKAKHGY